MSEIKVSVVIPVYNSEPYLEQCLNSVVNQSLKEIEIICVDDGSSDASLEILDHFAQSDKRVKILTQKHENVGAARNYGKSIATGKYLIYWDSDDYFKTDALEKMYEQAEVDQADICVCGGRQYYEDIDIECPWPSYLITKQVPAKPFNRIENSDYILTFTNIAVWNKLYNRRFLNQKGVEYPKETRGGDAFFTVCNFCLADRITYVDEQLVVYRRTTPGGLVSTISQSSKQMVDVWLRIVHFLVERDILPRRSFINKELQWILYVFEHIDDWTAFKETFLYIKEHLEDLLITLENPVYYDNDAYPILVNKLRDSSPEDCLIWLKTRYYLLNSKGNAKRRLENEKHKKRAHKLEKLEKKLEQETKTKETYRQELKEVKNSRSYKIGKKICSLTGIK